MRFPLLAAAGRRPLETSQSYKTLHIGVTSHSHSHKSHLKFLSRIQESGKLDTRYNCVLLSVEYLAFFLLLLQFFFFNSTTVVYWPPCQPLDHHYKVTAYQPIRFSPTKYQNYANCLFCSRNFLFQADTLAAACSLHVDSVPATGR